MSLDRQLRRLLEKHANFHVPLSMGDPNIGGFIGSVIDLGDADGDRPVVGHLRNMGTTLPTPAATGAVDVSLSLSKSLTFKFGAGGSGSAPVASAKVTATAKVRSSRDVVVLVEPTPGFTIETELLGLAKQVAAIPSWKFQRHVVVFRTFAVASGELKIARAGDGEITLKGSAQDVSKAINGEVSAGVQWTETNLYTKKFDAPGVLGVHLVRVTQSGQPPVL